MFDPFVTLWAFLSQVLDADKSCHNAVSRVIAWLSSENVEIPSQDTGAYCQARQRLPEKLLQKPLTWIENFIPQLLATSENKRHKSYRTLLAMIVHKSVPDRPGRSEPRVRKRRQSSLSSYAATSLRTTSTDSERLIKLEHVRLNAIALKGKEEDWRSRLTRVPFNYSESISCVQF